MLWTPWVLGVVAGGLMLAGCGEDPPLREAQGADRRQMETAVKGWLAGLADGDGEAGCSHLTGDARDRVKDESSASSCEEAVRLLADQFSPEGRQTLKGTGVRIGFTRGDTGTADLDTDTRFAGTGPLPLEKVDGTWKVDGYAVASAPPHLLGMCVVASMQSFDRGETDAYWKREGRADFRDFARQLCTQAAREGTLEAGRDLDQAAYERIAAQLFARMVRRGQLRDPR